MDAPSLARAEEALAACVGELRPISRHAAQSLEEGLDEVLAIHRLGITGTLRRHLRTTNPIESLNAQVEDRLGRIKRYASSDQRCQWVALALLEAEMRLRRLDGYRHLPLLQQALLQQALHRHIDRLTEELTAAS